MEYVLEKAIWTDEDYDQMGWHDATLWSTAARPEAFEYLLDLDYIFGWVAPLSEGGHFRLWVAPATMVFHRAHSVVLNIESQFGAIEIADFHRGPHVSNAPNGGYECEYRFECQEGEIRLTAKGYSMYVRRSPMLIETPFSLDERGGVSFERCMV